MTDKEKIVARLKAVLDGGYPQAIPTMGAGVDWFMRYAFTAALRVVERTEVEDVAASKRVAVAGNLREVARWCDRRGIDRDSQEYAELKDSHDFADHHLRGEADAFAEISDYLNIHANKIQSGETPL